MKKNLFLENLKELIDNKKIVTIFTDIFEESYTGYIIRISKDLLLLNSFNLSTPDGIKIFRLDDITRIRWDSNELAEIEKLIEFPIDYERINTIDIDNIKNAIESVQNIFGYLTIHIQTIDTNICFIGEMKAIDDETIILHEYGTIKSKDRSFLLLALQDITRIDSGGIYEKQLVKIKNDRRDEGGFLTTNSRL